MLSRGIACHKLCALCDWSLQMNHEFCLTRCWNDDFLFKNKSDGILQWTTLHVGELIKEDGTISGRKCEPL